MLDFSASDLDEIYSSGKSIAQFYDLKYQRENEKLKLAQNTKYNIDVYLTHVVKFKSEVNKILRFFSKPENFKKYYDYNRLSREDLKNHNKISKQIKQIVIIISEEVKVINASKEVINQLNPINDIRKRRSALIQQMQDNAKMKKNINKLYVLIDAKLRDTENVIPGDEYISRLIKNVLEVIQSIDDEIKYLLDISK